MVRACGSSPSFPRARRSTTASPRSLVLVAPVNVKKADLIDVSHLLRVTRLPLLGLIAYKPSAAPAPPPDAQIRERPLSGPASLLSADRALAHSGLARARPATARRAGGDEVERRRGRDHAARGARRSIRTATRPRSSRRGRIAVRARRARRARGGPAEHMRPRPAARPSDVRGCASSRAPARGRRVRHRPHPRAEGGRARPDGGPPRRRARDRPLPPRLPVPRVPVAGASTGLLAIERRLGRITDYFLTDGTVVASEAVRLQDRPARPHPRDRSARSTPVPAVSRSAAGDARAAARHPAGRRGRRHGGRLDAQKAPLDMVEAIARSARGPTSTWSGSATGDLRAKTERLIEREGLADRFLLLGDRTDVAEPAARLRRLRHVEPLGGPSLRASSRR